MMCMHLRIVQAHMARWPRPADEHEELGDRRPLDRARDRVLELPSQVGDGLGLHVLHARAVGGVVEAQLLGSQELADLVVACEVEPSPVDDRVAAENEPYRLEVGERELVERLQALDAARV